MGKEKKDGFTLLEAVSAIAILVVAVAMALSGYVFMLRNANQGDVQHELDVDAQKTIESLKKDLRLSSMDEIFYYSETGLPSYTAISFPVAHINPSTGRLNRDPATREIIWDETIIYHIRPGSPDELVKTTFSPRDNTIDDPGRQSQLNQTVANGGASGSTPNVENATSKVIFSNLLNWGMDPRRGVFSGYAPASCQEEISLGYALLETVTNSFTFTVVGRHPDSTGYKIGLDRILGSPSYRYREAETQSMSYSDTMPTSEGNFSYGNRHELLLDAAGEKENFTLVLDNDRWEDTDFGDLSGGGFSEQDKTTIMPDYVLDDIVVKLEGMDTVWETEAQTGDFLGINWATNLQNTTVQIMLKGSQVENGGYIRSIGQRSRLTFMASTNSNLKIGNVLFGESAQTNTTSMAYNVAPQTVNFNGNSLPVNINAGTPETSNWIDVPIDKDKNYIVTFDILSPDSLQTWKDKRAYDSGTARTTQITIPSGSTNIVKTYLVPCLALVEASYVDEGVYTSDIFDTRLSNPQYGDIAWNADIPSGTTLSLKVRTGDNPDLSDASDWSLISGSSVNPSAVGGSHKRYIQFQATLQSDASNEETPLLKDVTIDWVGERRMVNIMGKFSKGPDYANFELSVNGKPVQSALIINLEIYKEVQVENNQTRRASSSIRAEITPRNSSSL